MAVVVLMSMTPPIQFFWICILQHTGMKYTFKMLLIIKWTEICSKHCRLHGPDKNCLLWNYPSGWQFLPPTLPVGRWWCSGNIMHEMNFELHTVIFNNYTLARSILPPAQIGCLPHLYSATSDCPNARHPAHTFHISISPIIPSPQAPISHNPPATIRSPVVQCTITYQDHDWTE